ncbi:MAG TPA: PhoH family protein [Planctomycetota bacterium]|nr:PhoH family protein [Planctomycetota bacterium]
MKVKHKIHLASQNEVRSLLGAADSHIRKIASELNVQVVAREQTISLQGPPANVSNATMVLDELLTIVRSGGEIEPHDVDRLLSAHLKSGGSRPGGFDRDNGEDRDDDRDHRIDRDVREREAPYPGARSQPGGWRSSERAGSAGHGGRHEHHRGQPSRGSHEFRERGPGSAGGMLYTSGIGRGTGAPPQRTGIQGGLGIAARSPGQQAYLDAIHHKRMVFGVGPAGTGKTFLAAGLAVEALISGEVSRIMLIRPAVEAGEKLGYLPGDLREKIDPYLRPLYDALNDLLSPSQVLRYMERGSIEIAPLAYMRGRTINNTFAILDEAQNTTPKQMLMFLTRMGENSQMVVTGDMTQTDLEGGQPSGLYDALQKLEGIEDIGVVHLTEMDIVRHPLVVQVVRAYEVHNAPRHPLFEHAEESGNGGDKAGSGESAANTKPVRRSSRRAQADDADDVDDSDDAEAHDQP